MRKWIISLGGAGFLPIGPGTWGSVVTVIALAIAYRMLERAEALSNAWTFLLIGGVVFFSVLSVALGPWAVVYFGKKDPSCFVIDEAAGICLTMLLQPRYAGWHELLPLLVGLACFRLFDITKPPPARQLERLPAGWGILLDDLMAAIYANVVAQFVLRFIL